MSLSMQRIVAHPGDGVFILECCPEICMAMAQIKSFRHLLKNLPFPCLNVKWIGLVVFPSFPSFLLLQIQWHIGKKLY